MPADLAQAGALAGSPDGPLALVLHQAAAVGGAEDQLAAQVPVRLQRPSASSLSGISRLRPLFGVPTRSFNMYNNFTLK